MIAMVFQICFVKWDYLYFVHIYCLVSKTTYNNIKVVLWKVCTVLETLQHVLIFLRTLEISFDLDILAKDPFNTMKIWLKIIKVGSKMTKNQSMFGRNWGVTIHWSIKMNMSKHTWLYTAFHTYYCLCCKTCLLFRVGLRVGSFKSDWVDIYRPDFSRSRVDVNRPDFWRGQMLDFSKNIIFFR